MKIYFEDGVLIDSYELSRLGVTHLVDAKYGYYDNEKNLDIINGQIPNAIIYTNQITALDNRYAWNAELKVPEVYIRNKDGDFTRIDKLTNRELREAHNLMRMYIANEFGNFDWM